MNYWGWGVLVALDPNAAWDKRFFDFFGKCDIPMFWAPFLGCIIFGSTPKIKNIVKHIFDPLINRIYKKADLLQLPDHQCDSKNIFVKERKSN